MTCYSHLTEPRRWGRDLFARDAGRWRAAGWEVLSPIEQDDLQGGPDAVADKMANEGEGGVILRDLGYVAACDAVAARPDWVQSRVGRLELHMALVLGRPIYCAETGRNIAPEVHAAICGQGAEPVSTLAESTVKQSVLQEAERLIAGARQNTYGAPLDDFTRTGRLWGAILGLPDIAAEKVALMMVGVKMSREVNCLDKGVDHRDNRVDGAGYWGTEDAVIQERKKRGGKA